MVKWRDRRKSENVDDRRGAAGIGGLILLLIRFIIGRYGLRGLAFLAIIGAGFYFAGVNPVTLLENASGRSQTAQPVDDDTSQFVRAVLAETEDVWTRQFDAAGLSYEKPTLVLFSSSVSSACGFATAAVGPFYCPLDKNVYLDANFFQELAQRFNVPGDFPAVYVIAHEIGHHVQTLTGVSASVRRQQEGAAQSRSNALQVRMELQADCFAGIFSHDAERFSNFLDNGDIDEGLRAASAIGDDTLQRNAGRRVTPDSFTHGTSAQRMRWFSIGYQSGDVDDCDTFTASTL